MSVGLLGFMGMPILMVLRDKLREGADARVGWHRLAGAILLTLGAGVFVADRFVPIILSGGRVQTDVEAFMGIGFTIIVVAAPLILMPNKLPKSPSKLISRLTFVGLFGMGLGLVLFWLGLLAVDRLIPLNWFWKLFAINFAPACFITGVAFGLPSLGLLGYCYFKAKKTATEEDNKAKV